jgi:hypothetical protein
VAQCALDSDRFEGLSILIEEPGHAHDGIGLEQQQRIGGIIQIPDSCRRAPPRTSIAKTYSNPMRYWRLAQAQTMASMSQCLRRLVLPVGRSEADRSAGLIKEEYEVLVIAA